MEYLEIIICHLNPVSQKTKSNSQKWGRIKFSATEQNFKKEKKKQKRDHSPQFNYSNQISYQT